MMITVSLFIMGLSAGGDGDVARGSNLALGDIVIRDPFVLPVGSDSTYYLYGTRPTFGQAPFLCYTSQDLEHWAGPHDIIDLPANFWASQDYWAPEVHLWKGRYYLFATYAAEKGTVRRTHIAVADRPLGPFKPIGDEAQTPRGWMCLDGTLFVDEVDRPWMVFCHEWVQVQDGEICAIPLTDDLAAASGEPILLFRASSAPWVAKRKDKVTDGPFLHRTKTGDLVMLWSSFGHDGKYKVGLAHSRSGTLHGPWSQHETPLFEDDGGHAMLFRTFDGVLMAALHAPNSHPSRPRLYPVIDAGDTLTFDTSADTDEKAK